MTQPDREERTRAPRKAVGDRLRSIRLARGLKQHQLADLAKVDRSNYNQIEGGNRGLGPEVATRLANALEVSLIELGLDHLAPEEEWKPLADRQLELRDEVTRLVGDVRYLGSRVDALERRVPPGDEQASGEAG